MRDLVMRLMLAGLMVGCVSKSKHERATSALATSEAERAKLEEELRRLEAERKKLQGELEQKLAASEEELAELRRQREAQKEQLELFDKFTAKLQSMIDVGDIDVSIRRGRMVVGMPSRVLFPSGEHELSEKGKGTLKKVAVALAELPERRFVVAGHTDDMPIGEKIKTLYEDNWDLSARRALVVTRFLIEQGVAPASLAAAGYGQHDPAVSNKTAAGRKKNRRIELIVEPELSQLQKIPEMAPRPASGKSPPQGR